MKTLMRCFGLAFLAVAFLGLVGCGPDNESEAQRLQKGVGAVPTTDVKGGAPPAPISNAADLAERRKKEMSKNPMDSEYAKKGGGGAPRGR